MSTAHEEGDASREDPVRLREILDRLEGIPPLPEEEELRELDALSVEPLPEEKVSELVARVLELDKGVRQARAIAASRRPLQRRRWWRRPAAVIPLASLILLGATLPLVLTWSGRRSSAELSFEEAIDEVFNPDRPISRRVSAQGRVHTCVKRAITAIKAFRGAVPSSDERVTAAVAELRLHLAEPQSSGPVVSSFKPWHFEERLALLKDQNAQWSKRAQALEDVLSEACQGIETLHHSKAEHPKLSINADRWLRYLQEHLNE